MKEDKIKIIVHVQGGCVTSIATDQPDCNVFDVEVFDKDLLSEGEYGVDTVAHLEQFSADCKTEIW